jgi:hypothetical protein
MPTASCFIERLPAAVALDDPRHQQFSSFEGRKALATAKTLATPPDLSTFRGQTRVGHLGFNMAAERTVHASLPEAKLP